MKIFGIAGWSGSGKTTLLTRLLPHLVGRGLRVAVLKHTHHQPALGDDDLRAQAEAGATECLVASPRRFALLHRHGEGEDEPSLEALTGRFAGIDLLLVEGFKRSTHPRLMLLAPDEAMPEPTAEGVVAFVSASADSPIADRPVFSRDDVAGIAEFILRSCML